MTLSRKPIQKRLLAAHRSSLQIKMKGEDAVKWIVWMVAALVMVEVAAYLSVVVPQLKNSLTLKFLPIRQATRLKIRALTCPRAPVHKDLTFFVAKCAALLSTKYQKLHATIRLLKSKYLDQIRKKSLSKSGPTRTPRC